MDTIPRYRQPFQGLEHALAELPGASDLGVTPVWLVNVGVIICTPYTAAICHPATGGYRGTADMDRVFANLHAEEKPVRCHW